MARQIFRYRPEGQTHDDIYTIENGAARHLMPTEWESSWSGQSDVQDLGLRGDLYSQYFPSQQTITPPQQTPPPQDVNLNPPPVQTDQNQGGIDFQDLSGNQNKSDIDKVMSALQQGYADVNDLANATGLDLDTINEIAGSNYNVSSLMKYNQTKNEQQAKLDQVITQLNNISTGNFTLTGDEQAQLDAAKSNIDAARQALITANQNYEKSVLRAGIRTGRQEFMNDIATGDYNKAIQDGIERVRKYDADSAALVSKLKTAFKDSHYKDASDLYEKLDKQMKDKTEAIAQIQKMTKDYYDEVQKSAEFNLDVLKYQLDVKNSMQTTDTKEYDLAKNEGFDGSFMDFLLAKQQLTESTPTSYQEWSLAGGDAGTGMSYAEWLSQKDPSAGPTSYQEWSLAGGEAGTGMTYAAWLTQNKGLSGPVATRVQTIAGQFDGEQAVKNYQTIAETLDAVKSAGVTPTDDIQRIYAFAKIMDPNSAVREGEYKTVQDYSTALMERVGLKGQRIFDNKGFLTAEARDFILTTLNNRLASSQKAYDNIYNSYIDKINKQTGSTDGADYLTDYSSAFKEEPGQVEPLRASYANVGALLSANPSYASIVQNVVKALTDQNIEASDENVLQILEDNYSLGSPNLNANGDVSGPMSLNFDIKIPTSSKLAYVNNNPGNLRYANQVGATKGKGGFAFFKTALDGFKALINQVKLDASRNHTLASFINKYAPPSENNTGLYQRQLAKRLGVKLNTPISKIDPVKLAKEIAKKESSTIIG